ncbi:DUF1801 domain-containing protein [Roseateles amylovorans]|uniref:DUF1801 domain-containing protein n=1 Tax=Roseateles amylovorans TaxID=2978473 RepID=A0ABY6B149_9BURK|nr:DUF1801 domain-containing protein [Roseateles amylovorans]UXH79122.1 DUF1801 domain-containing protein [Roseateles amylovorans]
MADLTHACKPEVQALRAVILGADPSIEEGVKWNAPSFRTTEYFATLHLRAKDRVGLILHLGAKVREASTAVDIQDPDHVLKWLAKDRAMIEYASVSEIEAHAASLRVLLSQWIRHV